MKVSRIVADILLIGCGAGVGVLATRHYYQMKYEQLAKDREDAIRALYSNGGPEVVDEPEVEEAAEPVESMGMPTDIPEKNLRDSFKGMDLGTVDYAGMYANGEEPPTYDENVNTMLGGLAATFVQNTKSILYSFDALQGAYPELEARSYDYFLDDHTLAVESTGEIIENVDEMVGNSLEASGFLNEDCEAMSIIVCNFDYGIEMCINRVEGSYSDFYPDGGYFEGGEID